MSLSCNLYVDGKFEGTINSSAEVNIGKHGHILGDIKSKRVVVQGLLEGSVNADKIEIKADGKINGSIESNEFVIEPKGIFEGNSVVKNTTSKEAPKKITSK